MKGFIRSTRDPSGTSLKGEISATYSELVAILGKPQFSDEYKVSSEWTLENESGDVITLYDWKETNLYAEDLPSVEEFRASAIKHSFHVGARNKSIALAFIEALSNELAGGAK